MEQSKNKTRDLDSSVHRFEIVHFCANKMRMKRERFLSSLRRWCRRNGRELRVDRTGGKGSHVKVFVDGRQTVVKDGEIGPILKEIMLKQLGIPKDAF
jgi:hypothetical protein